MTETTDRQGQGNGSPWESIGRAAEDFARRVARDAGKFAHRMEEHAGEFARDVSRDWRRAQRDYRRRYAGASHHMSAPDVRRIFDDIRTVLADVLEGVDELISRVFEPGAHDDEWVRVVSNREAACGACGRPVAAGDDVWVRHAAAGLELRCNTCGARASADSPRAS